MFPNLVAYHIYRGEPIPLTDGRVYDYLLAGNGLFVRAETRFWRAAIPVARCRVRGLPDLSTRFILKQPRLPNSLLYEVVDELGLCRGLPSSYLQEPGLLQADPIAETTLSCAELTLREEQSLLINTQVAAVAAQYLYDLVIRCTLDQYATYLNLEPPVLSSRR
jgi:hypothetical protein